MTASLFVPALLKAIDARFSADTTLLALLAGGTSAAITATFPPPATDPQGSTTYPKLVFRLDYAKNDDSFPGRRFDCKVSIHIFVAERDVSGSDSYLVLWKIHERVMGDWPEQSNRIPTYGLDRWRPDFSAQTGDAASSYVSENMQVEDTSDVTEEDGGLRRLILSFSVALNRNIS